MVALTYEELQAIIQATVHGTQATLSLGSTSVAKHKLKDRKKFDGKPTTPFTSWLESVQEYVGFYPQATDVQWIAWIGTLLRGMARDWHQHRRRIMGDRDTWVLYSANMLSEYRDRQEAANAQRKLGEIEYKGDIKAYLTEFWSLNVYAQCTRESLQEKTNLAMPRAIIDMQFAHHMGEFIDDEHFLTTTYKAEVHVEQCKPLEEIRGRRKEKEGKEGPSQG